MTIRTTTRLVRFWNPFSVAGIDQALPPNLYRVDTDEELIDGLSFLAWKRTATFMHLPAECQASHRAET